MGQAFYKVTLYGLLPRPALASHCPLSGCTTGLSLSTPHLLLSKLEHKQVKAMPEVTPQGRDLGESEVGSLWHGGLVGRLSWGLSRGWVA